MTINLGNIVSVGDKKLSSGISSGFDSVAFVKNLTDVRRLPAVSIEADIEVNITKTTEYGNMKNLLANFKTASDFLRNPPGLNSASNNVFEYRQVSLSSADVSDVSQYVNITASPGSDTQDFDIAIEKLATSKEIRSQAFTSKDDSVVEASSGTTTGLFSAGSFDIAIGGQVAGTVSLVEGDSLLDIRDKVNNLSNITGVSASIIKVAEDDFRLTIKSENTGLENAFTLVDSDSEVADVSFDVVQDAGDASLEINGLAITRGENIIDDVFDNVTIELVKETPNFGTDSQANITSVIKQDVATAESGIINFINAYNEYRTFLAEQTAIDEKTGKPKENAVLGKETVVSASEARIFNQVSSIVANVSDVAFSSLASIGITFQDFPATADTPEVKNGLIYDPSKLKDALANNYEKVREVFEFKFSSSSTDLQVFSRDQAIELNNFKLDIDFTRTGDEVRVLDASDDSFLFNMSFTETGGGTYSFKGQEGTSLEGLTLLYAGQGSEVVSASISQGIGDKLYNITDNLTKEDGEIEQAVSNISDENDRFKKEVTRIDEQIDKYRDLLISQFTAMEEAITRVNTLLQFIEANDAFLTK